MTTTADAAASGVSFTWAQADGDTAGGVGAVTRFVVYKKDVQGNWVKLTTARQRLRRQHDRGGGAGRSFHQCRAADAADRNDGVLGDLRHVELRQRAALRRERPADRQLRLSRPDHRARPTYADEFHGHPDAHRHAPVATIGVVLNYASATSGLVTWQAQPSNIVQAFRYRAREAARPGAPWPWRLAARACKGSIRRRWQPALSSSSSSGRTWRKDVSPYAHALGNFTVTAAVAPVVVPPVGFPNVTGVTRGQPHRRGRQRPGPVLGTFRPRPRRRPSFSIDWPAPRPGPRWQPPPRPASARQALTPVRSQQAAATNST